MMSLEMVINYLEEAKKYMDTDVSGFLLCQEWWSGQYDKYFNMRFIKPRENWRYKGVVHEYLSQNGKNENVKRLPDEIILFQDRTLDNNKSGPRFKRDKELLLKEYEKDPTEPRTVFYLAQTCSCLGEKEEALKYYSIRTDLEGFWEEVFQAYLRCGEISQKLFRPWHESMTWYIKAFEHTKRVEPVLNIAEHYQKEKDWMLSIYICRSCLQVTLP